MNKNKIENLQELIQAGIIDEVTVQKIHNYYEGKKGNSVSKMLIVFSIFGAFLIGSGIILIIAHNWDELSKTVKTICAFLPLIIGQFLYAYTFLKKKDNVAWKESTSTFLFFAVGACISLISQIYNIHGDLSSFLLLWMLLCLPLIYILKANAISLFYIAGTTYYACEVGYWSYPHSEPYLYWILLLLAIPRYSYLLRKLPESNFTFFHNWIIPLSLIISLGTISKQHEIIMFISYLSLFGIFQLLGNVKLFNNNNKIAGNGYRILGMIGTNSMLLSLSFKWFWEDLARKSFIFSQVIISPEFLAAALLSITACILLFVQSKSKSIKDINPFELVFIIFIITFILGRFNSTLPIIFINVTIFIYGIAMIRRGAITDHLGILNYGLLIITALITCRFFDINISFIIRGVLFVAVGTGFFLANYFILHKRKIESNKDKVL